MKDINFTQLQEEVMFFWENEGYQFVDPSKESLDEPRPHTGGCEILPMYQDILDDPIQCVNELGYDSISSYIASRGQDD